MNKFLLFGAVFLITVFSATAAILSGSDVYNGSGELNGYTYGSILNEWSNIYLTNPNNWNITQEFTTNNSLEVIWVPWYEDDNEFEEGELKDDYVDGSATWTKNTAVSDEYSEWLLAVIYNLSSSDIQKVLNYMTECKSTHSDYLTAWHCERYGNEINSSDRNSASDASARFAQAFYLASTDSDHTTQERAFYLSYAENITKAMKEEETVTNCQDSAVNSSAQLCEWHLAGAGQAWGGGALEQVGEQAFIGYSPDQTISDLLACANTGNSTYCEYAEDEAHQFLYAVQYNLSEPNTYTQAVKHRHYYMNCSGPVCTTEVAFFDNNGWEDADAPRAWEMCNAVNAANIVYNNNLPWEFQALESYCDAWAQHVDHTGNVFTSSTDLVDGDNGCAQITDTATCKTTVNNDNYRGIGWTSNMVAYKENVSYYESYISGPLQYYDVSNKYYTQGGGEGSPTIRGFGIYGQTRPLRSIKAATGMYEDAYAGNTFDSQLYYTGVESSTILTDFTIFSENQNTNVTGGSAIWYADISTSGDQLKTNSTGIYFTNIEWQENGNTCTASSLTLTSGTYNTSQFSSSFPSLVDCQISITDPSQIVKNVCSKGFIAADKSTGIFVIMGIAVVAIVAVGLLLMVTSNNTTMAMVQNNSSQAMGAIIGLIIAMGVFVFIIIMAGGFAQFCV